MGGQARTSKQATKTCDFARGGQGRSAESRFTVDVNFGLEGPTKQAKQRKGRNREAANQNEHEKTPKADLQKCTVQHVNFACDRVKKKAKRTQGKVRTPAKYGDNGKINTRQWKESKKTQKQQNSTAKTKATKKATKTAALFVLRKTLRAQQKCRGKPKRPQKICYNQKQTQNKPQTTERAPKRQNSAARPTLPLPSTLPTGQQKILKIFRFQFLKKMNQSKFCFKKL